MYEHPDPTAALGFGDIIEAPWINDLYLASDCVRLNRGEKGRFISAEPGERTPPIDILLAHGNPRRAIIVTDDCALDSVLGRNGQDPHGRILVAAIRDSTTTQVAALAEKDAKFGQFPLPADDTALDFKPGIVEFERTFAIYYGSITGKSALTGEDPKFTRLASLNANGKSRLAQAWAAHVVRHGPLVADDGTRKYANQLTVERDPTTRDELLRKRRLADREDLDIGEAVAATLAAAWELEGAGLDEVSYEWETNASPERSHAILVKGLRTIHNAATVALALMENDEPRA
jgi:hypothetical protein